MKKLTKTVVLLSIITLLVVCGAQQELETRVLTGLDRIHEYREMFKGKRVGIITNHTAYNSQHQHITDIFAQMEDVTIAALFGPEHGIRGSAEAGAKVDSEKDPLKGIPIYSLYGKTKKPTPEMLKHIDILVFDIQDIGTRYYTYISTMAYAMEAAAEQKIPFVVLDRPNPITGTKVEGNVLEKEFASFVGLFPIPVRHGMTVGELATMINQEGWLRNGIKANLTVIPMKYWQRKFWYDETGLPFIKPSPNIPDLMSAIVYPGTCLLEGTNVSEGRGTHQPFQVFGAPWIDAQQLTRELNALNLPGVTFLDTVFTPVSIPGMATHPKYENRKCYGAFLQVTDREQFQPYKTGIHIVNTIYHMYPDSLQWRITHFDRLCGSDAIRKAILKNIHPEEIFASWKEKLDAFKVLRTSYLLYPEG